MKDGKMFRSLAEARAANALYQRAEEEWKQGRMRLAFRWMLGAAKAGMVPAFGTVAQFYDRGDGVRANQGSALYWYQRAYQSGDHSVANNIGCILRDRKKTSQALRWFRRAVDSGDGDANLNIAKVYLHKKRDIGKAIQYLIKTRRSKWATEGSKDEARLLLMQLKDAQERSSIPRGARSRQRGSTPG
ncbi:MAG TPA: hypothetical protein VHX36_15590 [Candidatus Acidoferrales bacterium]|jgi:TPR repeat protein|nr:hypothetical protein [Candidatus Acidoferrales bacterium]